MGAAKRCGVVNNMAGAGGGVCMTRRSRAHLERCDCGSGRRTTAGEGSDRAAAMEAAEGEAGWADSTAAVVMARSTAIRAVKPAG